MIPNMSILHPIPALLTTSIAETKIGSLVQSILESQSFLFVKLKAGQLTVPKEFVGIRKLKPEHMDTLEITDNSSHGFVY